MSKPLDYFSYQAGELCAEDLALSKIAEQFGTPTYVYSAAGFLEPYRELDRALGDLPHLIAFAVKSCSNLSILKLLHEAGAGMDVVTGGELFRVQKAGVPGSKTVFSGVGKSISEIQEGLRAGIHSFNVESLSELRLIALQAEQNRQRVAVALRFNPDVDPKTHPYISTGLKKNKFGLHKAALREGAAFCRDSKWIQLSGLSVHIGSQINSLSPFRESYLKLRDMMVELNQSLRTPLQFVDLGGGLGITYKNEKTISPQTWGKLVKTIFGPLGVRIICEPGRFLSGNAGILLTKVLHRKRGAGKEFLIVDAAMNDLMRPALYQSHHEIRSVQKSVGPLIKMDVVGPVCESSDRLGEGRSLPKKIATDDLIAILSAGAYGFSMSSQYNSRPRASEVLVDQTKVREIRARESYEDLIRGES